MKSLARASVAMLVVVAAVFASISASADKDKDKDDHDQPRPRPDAGPPPPPPPTTAHGANFQVKNGLDNSFCMDVGGGATEGRSMSLSSCAAVPSQRWMFTWNSGETNSIVESQGMCADTRGRHAGDGLPIQVFKCHHGGDEKFTFTPTGHIQYTKSGKCLSVPRAAAGVAVFLEDCDESKKQQTWKLAQ